MRILSFNLDWPKLKQSEFTTFRYSRGAQDWEVGERVKIIIHPRSKGGGTFKGIAEIVQKENRLVLSPDPHGAEAKGAEITEAEAVADGFKDREDMVSWMEATYGDNFEKYMYKLTLRWELKEEGL